MKFVYFVASCFILYMMLYVAPIKATYNATLDNFPLWPFVIAFNLFISIIFSDTVHYVDDMSFRSYVGSINLLIVSMSQLIMERNIRQQQQRDQHHGITNVTPTLGAIRVAILFTFLSKLFMFVRFESFLIHAIYRPGVMYHIILALDVVVYSEFLYHTGGYVNEPQYLLSITMFLTIRFLLVKTYAQSTWNSLYATWRNSSRRSTCPLTFCSSAS